MKRIAITCCLLTSAIAMMTEVILNYDSTYTPPYCT